MRLKAERPISSFWMALLVAIIGTNLLPGGNIGMLPNASRSDRVLNLQPIGSINLVLINMHGRFPYHSQTIRIRCAKKQYSYPRG